MRNGLALRVTKIARGENAKLPVPSDQSQALSERPRPVVVHRKARGGLFCARQLTQPLIYPLRKGTAVAKHLRNILPTAKDIISDVTTLLTAVGYSLQRPENRFSDAPGAMLFTSHTPSGPHSLAVEVLTKRKAVDAEVATKFLDRYQHEIHARRLHSAVLVTAGAVPSHVRQPIESASSTLRLFTFDEFERHLFASALCQIAAHAKEQSKISTDCAFVQLYLEASCGRMVVAPAALSSAHSSWERAAPGNQRSFNCMPPKRLVFSAKIS
jgi:hypothetical protein